MLKKTQLALMVGYLASGFTGRVLAQDNGNSATDNSTTNKPDTLIVTSQVQSWATKLATLPTSTIPAERSGGMLNARAKTQAASGITR